MIRKILILIALAMSLTACSHYAGGYGYYRGYHPYRSGYAPYQGCAPGGYAHYGGCPYY